jgi:hypothetical protein
MDHPLTSSTKGDPSVVILRQQTFPVKDRSSSAHPGNGGIDHRGATPIPRSRIHSATGRIDPAERRRRLEGDILRTLARSKGPLTIGELFAHGSIRGGRAERRRALGRLVRRGQVEIGYRVHVLRTDRQSAEYSLAGAGGTP